MILTRFIFSSPNDGDRSREGIATHRPNTTWRLYCGRKSPSPSNEVITRGDRQRALMFDVHQSGFDAGSRPDHHNSIGERFKPVQPLFGRFGLHSSFLFFRVTRVPVGRSMRCYVMVHSRWLHEFSWWSVRRYVVTLRDESKIKSYPGWAFFIPE